MVVIDRLFWLPHRLMESLGTGLGNMKERSNDRVLVIKFMGMGSIIQFASLCEEHEVDKSKLTLLTFERHRDLSILFGFCNTKFIRTENLRTLLIDCWRTTWATRVFQPSLIVDFERCSHAVGCYSKLLALASGCPSLSFESNRTLHTKHHDIFSVDHLNQEQLFLKGIERMSRIKYPRKLKVVQVETTKIIVNINASNYLLARRYPMNSFMQLIELLHQWDPRLIFMLTGSLNESTYVEGLINKVSVPVIRNVAGKWSLEKLVEELSNCALFITNDSGPLHLASYLKISTLAIWGPTQPKHFGYDTKASITSCSMELSCAPCLRHPNSHPAKACHGQISCMKNLEPSTIFEKVVGMLTSQSTTRTIYLPAACQA